MNSRPIGQVIVEGKSEGNVLHLVLKIKKKKSSH